MSDIKFKEVLDIEGKTVAEELDNNLIAIRQVSQLTGEEKTIYLTVDTIKHLADVLPVSEPAYELPGFGDITAQLDSLTISK